MKLPKEILVYRVQDDHLSYLAVADHIDGIPDDCNGDEVGIYILHQKHTFRVKRELK